MPVEARALIRFFITFTFSVFLWNKYSAWFDFDVQHDKFTPIEIQVNWSLFGVNRFVLNWNIYWFNKSSSYTIWNGLDEFSLGWSLSVINTKDVLLILRWILKDVLDHTCKIFHMDCWDTVFTFTNNWKFLWSLLPCLFKMIIEDSFTKTI